MMRRNGFAGLLIALFALLWLASLGGCVTLPAGDLPAAQVPPPGVAIEEVLAMLNAHRPQAEIAQEVRSRGLRTPPNQDDINILVQNGADNEVLESVAQARISTGVVAVNPTYAQPYGWWPWFGGLGLGWGYGGGYYRSPGQIHPGGTGLTPRPPGQFRGPSMPFRGFRRR